MDLSEYLETTTQQKLADAIREDDGVGVTQGAISQWLRKGVPPERVLQLVRVSNGAMSCHDLRPDIYPAYIVDPHADRDRTTADAREPTDAGKPIPACTAGGDDPTDKAAA